jgi:uncharacterized protein (DUF2336 family)
VNAGQSLIAELEDAIQSGSKDRRVDTLRRITDLFVADADRLSDQQIDVFDDVLGHLIKRIEAKALAELSRRLAPINNAPIDVVRRLARDDNIVVAEPILAASARLCDNDLIEIANTKTQAHLLAISARPQIGEAVTDVLLQRGGRDVFRCLAGNTGASFSQHGFETLVRHAERDEQLAEKVGLRLDVPLRHFRELLLRATEAVRARLLTLAGPENRNHIQRVLARISKDAQHEASRRSEHDYAKAHAKVSAMHSEGKLDEGAIFDFANDGQYADIVAALSLLCSAPIPLVENLLHSKHREAILIPCKAAQLQWPTVRAILDCRSIAGKLSDLDVDSARTDFIKLSPSGAQRVLRFWQVRQTVSNAAASSDLPALGRLQRLSEPALSGGSTS